MAHLWEHPPVDLARRYVESMGGPADTLAKARAYVEDGDLRFAATLLNHLVFAAPDDTAAKEALAGVYDRLGHGAENGTWRNFYLNSAMELRHGVNPATIDTTGPEVASALTTDMLLDSIAVRIDGPRAWDEDLVIDLVLTDEGRRHRLTLHNGALTHRSGLAEPRTLAGLTLTLTRPQLFGLLTGEGLAGIDTTGDPALLNRLFSYRTKADPGFPIVTP
ncbi:alkyl sulfatase C-terminal domain-containing protein [Streptomyces sp. NPDC090127]|uniref:alkyl sulfatase C-terminal domain-containing protein n=1 Tax=Streptomyces sp. NPDC090127 TaxID=3365953 RepID=UPI00382C4E8D